VRADDVHPRTPSLSRHVDSRRRKTVLVAARVDSNRAVDDSNGKRALRVDTRVDSNDSLSVRVYVRANVVDIERPRVCTHSLRVVVRSESLDTRPESLDMPDGSKNPGPDAVHIGHATLRTRVEEK
jgi:hypothetical protein